MMPVGAASSRDFYGGNNFIYMIWCNLKETVSRRSKLNEISPLQAAQDHPIRISLILTLARCGELNPGEIKPLSKKF
jgi:hypothetical protein